MDANKTVLWVQLIAPVVVGLPVVVWGSLDRAAAKRSAFRGTAPGAQSALKPLVCPNCHAPVPLQRRAAPCPSCGTVVDPPADYVHLFELRKLAISELRRAERRWLLSRVWSSWPVAWMIRLAFLAWFVLVCWAAIGAEWSTPPRLISVVYAIFELVGGWYGAWLYRQASEKLPPVPAAQFRRIPAGAGTCRLCGAPVAFEENHMADVCPYCGGDNYREALAGAAARDAHYQAHAANARLIDATADLDERLDGIKTFIAFMFIAAVFYGGLMLIEMVLDWFVGPG